MKVVFAILLLPLAAVAAGRNELKLIAPYGELPPSFWERYGTGLAIAAIVLVVLTALAIWLWFRLKPAATVAPQRLARAALARLRLRPEDGQLLSEVSQILRQYAGAISGFSGGEMTTAEFASRVAADKNLGPQLAEALVRFLRVCDQDRFAAKNEAPPLNAVARALELVAQIEKRRVELSAPPPPLR